ncbi:hypothetical protein KG088_10515 [Halomonas sp. TRM85114]|uniref:hypothetical protein n=1 Tax=Halomonas jincaotanensis TaxID=2810616 RepID=UPI001BD6577E|nr:hypothetical protein [Halomonas jincaotanensis]MBS9404063.1 hypothetical protein [Halomonas jincaotanensis]
MRIAIVLVGYCRIHSILRLFESLERAKYRVLVDLVFSIDKSPFQDKICAEIRKLEWPYGEKKVRTFPQRLGLREHILSCGDLTDTYDAVVVLEDDIVVSDCFYDYVLKSISFVQDDDKVAGISLYSPSINEMAMLPFVPKRTGFDNYYLQSAQSWGQCWTRRMWQDFRKWYDLNSTLLEAAPDMPSRIYSWPESSWKKYYMKYLVDTDKTFFYPYDSYSSNYSDVGQHNLVVTPHFQVPLISGKQEFRFGTMDEVPCYDVFFERTGLTHHREDVCLDLYGTRKQSTCRYFLTTNDIKAPRISSYGLTYRPHEDNYVHSAPGCDIHLYDLIGQRELRKKGGSVSYKLAKYHTNLSWKHSLVYGVVTLIDRIIQKVIKK